MTPSRFIVIRYCVDDPEQSMRVICDTLEEAEELIETWLRDIKDRSRYLTAVFEVADNT